MIPSAASSSPSAAVAHPPQHRYAFAVFTRSRLGGWIVVTVVLLLVGLSGRELMRNYTDVPPWRELANDLQGAYAAGPSSALAQLLADHAPLTRLAKHAVVALNGQIDDRALRLIALGLTAAALASLLLLLRRFLRPGTLALVGAAGVAALLTPTFGHLSPHGSHVGLAAVTLLSLVHLAGTLSSSPNRAIWWLAQLCGATSVVAGTPGLASAVAVVAGALLTWRRKRGLDRHERTTFAVNLGLVFWGGMLALARARATGAPLAWTGPLLTWPFAHMPSALLLWLPAAGCVAGELRQKFVHPFRPVLCVLAIWSVALVALLVGIRSDADAAAPCFAAVVIVNAACWTGVILNATQRRAVRAWLVAGWAGLVGVALLHPVDERAPLEPSPADVAALADRIRGGHVDRLRSVASPDDRLAGEAIAATTDVAALLPVSIRPPLHLTIAAESSDAFRPLAPELREREGLPVRSTWSASGVYRTGEFVSEPISSRFGFVQLRFGGRLESPLSVISLRTSSGRDIAPLAAAHTADDRWRRLNFETPREPFRVTAHAFDPSEWLGFAEPVEIGGVSRYLAKLSLGWPTIPLTLGLVSAGVLGVVFAGSMRRRNAPAAAVAWRAANAAVFWRAVPWVALTVYAAYFAHYLDPTAGPNDSGGYLNSAKLMIGGHVTAEPRMIFGRAAGETDITPYVPITFHANGERMVPEYPVGWPLEVAAVGRLLGLQFGLPLLMLAQLVAGIVLTQRLARVCGLPDGWAWLGAGVLAVSPVYLFEALQPVSDGPALVWVTAAIYWAWLSRERAAYAVLAGAATALAVLIRPSNLLAVAPILLALTAPAEPTDGRLVGRAKRVALWAVAGAPGALWLMWYHQTLYGSWHTTGYGDIATSFEWRFLPLTARSYALWLPEMLTPLLALAVAMPFLRSSSTLVRTLLSVWVAVFIGFYAVYWCTWDNWYNMRFVLPAFPALIVATLLAGRALAARAALRLFDVTAPRPSQVLSVLLVGAVLGWGVMRTIDRRVTYWMENNHKPRLAAEWVRDNVPPNAVVFAKHMTGSLFHYTDLTFVRLDHPLARDGTAFYERIVAAGRPVYAMTCHWETRDYHWESGKGSGYPDLPGTWQRVAALCEDDVFVWRRTSLADVRNDR